MRVSSLVLAALPLAALAQQPEEVTPSLRGSSAHRQLTWWHWGWHNNQHHHNQHHHHHHNNNWNTQFFGGWATAGTAGCVPVNACFFVNWGAPHGQLFSNCDGKQAADQFCRQKGFGWATNYGIVDLQPHKMGYRSVVLGSNTEIDGGVAGHQRILDNVTCQR